MLQYRIDCDEGRGNAMACQSVGEFLSVVKNDRKAAGDVYEENCRRFGFAPSCFNVGRLYFAGKGRKQSDPTAADYFSKACEGGHAVACFHLGTLLLAGSPTVPKNVPRAMTALAKACDDRLADGCYGMAEQLLRSDPPLPVTRDPSRARAALEVACQYNHAAACFNLAVMYKNGDTGVPIDMEKFDKYADIARQLRSQLHGPLSGRPGARQRR
ncbi:unnamed protein product [Phaeothamnion confervicola]